VFQRCRAGDGDDGQADRTRHERVASSIEL
jgi:hypothetical protein